MSAKKRFKKQSETRDQSRTTETETETFEEIEPIEVGWEFHKVPLIISVVIAVVFYVLVFIFVK
ncbi:MAG: hypothetical protein PHV06_08570 [bacterium]|nr:hypothetical protein [bacterium]